MLNRVPLCFEVLLYINVIQESLEVVMKLLIKDETITN